MNEVKHISEGSLRNKPRLTRMDLSFNKLKDLKELLDVELPALKELYLISNKIRKIESLDHLTSLEFLELGDNHIRVRHCPNTHRHVCIVSSQCFSSTVNVLSSILGVSGIEEGSQNHNRSLSFPLNPPSEYCYLNTRSYLVTVPLLLRMRSLLLYRIADN